MKLKNSQKVDLLERILDFQKSNGKPTKKEEKRYAYYSGVVSIGEPFQYACGGGELDGLFDCRYKLFHPESNIEQAMMLLDSLCKVSNEHWKMNYAPTGEKRVYCQPRTDLIYNGYGNDLCELIVNACLWWIENKCDKGEN